MGLVGTKSTAAWVSRQAVRRGLLGSSRLWFGVFVARGAVKLARRAIGPRQPTVLLEEWIEPGTGIEVRNLSRDSG